VQDRLTISQVAAQVGVNVQTVRYYERRGILPQPERTPAGYRQYLPDTVRRIRFIKHAQDLGFSLDEIVRLIALRGSAPRRGDVRAFVETKVAEVEDRVRRLQAVHQALTALLGTCARTRTPRCPILEALEEEASMDAPDRRRGARRRAPAPSSAGEES
jgi:Hg(II)-responsive transcriptional regulator